MLIIYILTNIIFAYLGKAEAWGYSTQAFKVKTIKKTTLVPLRGLILFTIVAPAIIIDITLIAGIILAISLIFSFSFFHNGFYEVFDDKLKGNYRSFWKSFTYISPNDSSKRSYDFASRLYMFIFSLIILATGIIINETII